MRTRIKICGLRTPENALAAVAAGADAIGLVFYPNSPRSVTIAEAAAIARALPPFVSKVALLVDPSESLVKQVINEVGVDVLQFHGNESQAFCQAFDKSWYKAVRVKDKQAVAQALQTFDQANALLLDAFVEGVPGGTGEQFDWSLVPKDGPRIILAGGLTPDNVADAMAATRPYAVDVSGGVEASKGVKDPQKMQAFVKQVLAADMAR
ncbi:phosphoribosylanthranilate isomerase [Salinibius halmophilus]|uniref:phosphoribosylanthranilate isomerase n=1 Tax=Salinibius halmophilus TaxID=1853216 RepID=UPI000E669698|nr:phosphoribosylanthranilate isomerase [Salinibius halmophilus]